MLSRQIASKLRGYETPFYLYDMALLRQTLESVVYESKKYGYKVHYAIKANYDDHLLAVIREYGLGIDCASGNELRKAVEAGFDPKGIVYAGVGKRDKELKYAIEQNILAINCESIQELELVDALSAEAGKVTDIALRINPDIDPKTGNATKRLIRHRAEHWASWSWSTTEAGKVPTSAETPHRPEPWPSTADTGQADGVRDLLRQGAEIRAGRRPFGEAGPDSRKRRLRVEKIRL